MSLFFDEKRYSNQEILKMLREAKWPSGYKPSGELIDNIVKEFWLYDYWVNLISDPVFYRFLYDFLYEKMVETFYRPDFYDYFFRKILSKYFKGLKLELNYVALQKVGLIFEKFQTDTISLDKYDKLIKKIYGGYFIFSSEWLVDNKLASIVVDEKNPDQKNLKWAHHSLTEYLTAEYILKQKNPIKEAEKLMVIKQEGITAFKPSWTGVLSFLLESELREKFILWAVSFSKEYTDTLD